MAEIKQKIVTQAAEAEAFEKENDKYAPHSLTPRMRLDLQDMIKSYEEKEKLFWDKVKAKEEEQKNESQKYIQQFEQMQHNAQKAIQDKIVLEASERNITQKKLKLQIYKSKFAEFNHTLEKSYMSLVKIKEEVVKVTLHYPTLLDGLPSQAVRRLLPRNTQQHHPRRQNDAPAHQRSTPLHSLSLERKHQEKN